MKIAISGKGGVGKTTLAAFLAHVWREQGKKVLAVDADPDANLAGALGFPDAGSITPIADMRPLIEERTGAKGGTFGSFFKLNPKVDDLPEELAKEHEGIRLMVMGTVKSGGSGCVCPESVLLKNLIQHLLVERDEAVILDMEAGIEHLGRATAFAVNLMVIVVEPGKRSIETAENISKLAHEIGIKNLAAVACKVRGEDEAKFLADSLKGIPFIGYLPYSQEIIEADLKGVPPFQTANSLIPAAREIAKKIEELVNSQKA
jgi:CO dehydrogenase maturation factor